MATTSRGQRSVMNKVGGFLQDHVTDLPQGYSGDINAPMLPGYGQLQQMLGGYDPSQYNQLMGQGMQTALGYTQMQSPDGGREAPAQQIGIDPITNYWKQSTLNPMMRQFNNKIKPQIKSGFAGSSAFSSREGGAMTNALGATLGQAQQQLGAMQNQGQTLNAQLQQSQIGRQNTRDNAGAGMAMTGYANQIGAAQNYNQMAMQQALMPMQQAQGLAGALNPLQGQANQQASAKYADWTRQQRENSPWIQLALQYMGARTGMPTQQSNPWGGILGAALPLGLAAYSYATGPTGGNGGAVTSDPTSQIGKSWAPKSQAFGYL